MLLKIRNVMRTIPFWCAAASKNGSPSRWKESRQEETRSDYLMTFSAFRSIVSATNTRNTMPLISCCTWG